MLVNRVHRGRCLVGLSLGRQWNHSRSCSEWEHSPFEKVVLACFIIIFFCMGDTFPSFMGFYLLLRECMMVFFSQPGIYVQ